MNKKILLHAMLWNSFHIITYKIILQIHQTTLFYYTQKAVFGLIGTIFSTLYFLINVTNFGFDYALLTFKTELTASKKHFHFFFRAWIIRCIQLCILTLLFIWLYKTNTTMQIIPQEIQLYLLFIFICESIKKSLEFFASVLLLNKTVTFIEIVTLLLYCTIVWTHYITSHSISLKTVFAPLCITSFLELLYLLKCFFKFYQTLPPTSSYPTVNSMLFYKNQSINYINQLTKACFSPNCIIIIFAYHFGFIKAGIIKLMIDSMIVLYALLNRVVGIPSAAILSNRSILSESTLHIKDTFLMIKNRYIQFLYCIIISIFAYYATNIWYFGIQTLHIPLILFTLSTFLEFFIITYEKLFITQNATTQLATINAISLLCLAFLLYSHPNPSQITLLLPFLSIRLIATVIIAYKSYQTWGILPSFIINRKIGIFVAIVATLLFFIK